MKRFSVSAVSIFLLILSGFHPNTLSAQDQGSVRGQLGGVVVDPTGAIIQGASVTIMGPTGNATRASNDSGEFNFSGLIPGFYDVKVAKDGFKGTTVQKVEVGINKTSTIKVALELGAVTQTVEVVASAVSVESTSTAVTADISDTVYQNLPLGRSITSVFYVSPGVASGLGTGAMNPAISGGTGLENAYIADGVLLNDAAFGGLGVYQRRYGSLGVGINASFVKEVQVSTAAFGPQYGHSTGGVINMVTKSGSNAFHGVVGGYFQPRGTSALWANQDDFHTSNNIGRQLQLGGYEGDFQLGGYVPLGALKNHLFFFGAFNPTWNTSWVAPVPGTGLFAATNGLVDRKTTIWDYSGKLTWQLNSNHSIEGSVFGDPTHTNLAPWQTLNIDNISANTSQTFGSRNLAVRYNGTFGSSLILSGAFTMNWNQFSETPLPIPNITDNTQTAGLTGQRGAFRAQGYGNFENYDSNSKGVQFDVHKEFTFLGQHHTISAGYSWAFPTYLDTNGYSGPKFPISVLNHDGVHYLSAANEAFVAGQAAEVHLLLQVVDPSDPAQASCTLCPYMNVPGYATPQQVFLKQDRGLFNGFTSDNVSKYHAAYIDDAWEISKYATLEAGLRWEQQRMTSSGVTQLLNDQWGPRIGFTVDPKGDRKSKIYANFGRYAWVMPLDAALRELTVQDEINNVYYAPESTGGVGPANMVTLNSLGTVNFNADSSHILNNAVGGIAKNPTFTGISGNGGASPFAPGTKMEYNDEFVVGAEHEFRGGITTSVRYIDRRIKRIIEDFGGVSIEQSLAGFGQFYAIGNPNAATDVVANSHEIAFSKGAFFDSTTGTLPAGCAGATTVSVLNLQDTTGAILGSACFPEVNGLFGGEAGADGSPDGYLDPKREYQAIEVEVNKALSHNWSLIANWRIARLRGNFEGAFRNDNGQNDPGISSLYDFTPGLLNEIGTQLATGPLNADRLHILNVYPTYIFDKTFLRGLVVTPGLKIQSGVPLTTLYAQEAYGNNGEVPPFGRGDLGRAPVTGTVDVHLDYPWKISETKSFHFAIDMLNIANTKRKLGVNQFVDLDFGVLNSDFGKPGIGGPNGAQQYLVAGFVSPFSARFHVSFNF